MKNTNRNLGMVKFAVLALLTTAWAPQALRAANSQGCSNSTLKGTYMASSTGTVVGVGPAAVVNGVTFDGNGNGTVFAETISMNGTITTGVTGTVTYSVNANCSGSDTITMSTGAVADFNFLLNANGARFFFISTDSGFVASGEGIRLGEEK
ncbi:MAG TPA: hypothetical protein VG206_11515 [Terriglobia bacterium]|nr:hypothetical protein [Terriglobia bacterium]